MTKGRFLPSDLSDTMNKFKKPFTIDKSYASNLAKNQFATAPVQLQGKAIQFLMGGKLTTDGIQTANFDEKESYSVGFTSPDLEDAVRQYELAFASLGFLEGWKYNELIKYKNNVPTIYLKLKTDKNGDFTHSNNIGMINNNSDVCKFVTRECNLNVGGMVNTYFDPSKKTYGLYIVLNELEYDIEDIDTVRKYYQ